MIAKYVDILLLAMVALTIAMIAYKTLQLYLGNAVLKRPQPAALAKNANMSLPDRSEAVGIELERLESGMALIGALATAAPFVGLIGTVIHIMDALSKLSGASLDISLISGPIATALSSTLVGLASAVPAAIAYNLFSRRIQLLESSANRVFARELAEESST
jgi:biopolymer transport protein ExbB/TolQ